MSLSRTPRDRSVSSKSLIVTASALTLAALPAFGASGTWSADLAGNWSDPTKWSGGTVADGVDFTATLGNVITADRIVTLDTARTIGNITASDTSHNYTISGANILTLDRTSGIPVIDVTTNRTLTISSQISGSDGLQKNGAGTLAITSTSNNFTGGITLNGGTFTYSGNSLALNGNNVTFAASTNMQGFVNSASPNNVLTGSLTVNSGVTATISIPSAAWGYSQSGALLGSGTLSVTGASATGVIANFTNTGNTFTGALNNGTGTSATGGFTVSSIGDSANAITLGSAGTTAVTFGLNSNTAAPVTFNNRQFVIGTNGNQTVNINNNATASTSTFTVNTNLSVASTGTKTVTFGGTNTGTNTFAGTITNGSGSVAVSKTNTGTWELSGNNSYSGATTVSNNGTLILSGDNSAMTGGVALSAGTSLIPKLHINSATALGTGTLNFGGGAATDTVQIDNSSAGAVTVSTANPITLNRNFTFVGTQSLNLGTGTATIGGLTAGTNRSIVVTANTLTFGGVVTEGAGLNAGITVGGGGTLALTNQANTFNGSVNIGNNVSNSLKLQVTKLANVGSSSSIGTGNAGAIIQIGNQSNGSTLELVGGTSPSSTDWQVRIGSSNNGSGNATILNNNGNPANTLTFSNTAFNVAATGTATFSRNLILGGSNTGDNTIVGTIIPNVGTSGVTGLIKQNGGTWVLSANNSTYTGPTSVRDGVLKFTKLSDFGVASSLGAPTTGTTIAIGNTSFSGNLIYTGAGDSSNRTIRVGGNSTTPAVTDTGAGALLNDGTGAMIFTAGTFNTQTDASSGVGANRTLTLGGSYTGAANEIQGVIQDNLVSGTGTGTATVGITKAGAGTWAFSGANTYSGATTVNAGTLLINGNQSAAVGAVSVASGATLGGTGTIGGTVTVNGTGTLSPGASIESLVSGALTLNSGTTFEYEAVDNTATGADVMIVNGALSLTGVNLGLTGADLDALTWVLGDKLTLISYTGAAITSGFVGYVDDTEYTFGTVGWTLNYNDSTEGNNYSLETSGPTYVTLTVTTIPEPSTLGLLAAGAIGLMRRRRVA